VASIQEIKAILTEQKSYLKRKYGVKEIGIFGSYIRGQNNRASDLDILVELERPPKISLIGIVELENYLSDLLAIKVDLAIKKNLRKRIGKRILSEVEYI
jgi:predicted nucleotidyltransferase